MMGAFLLGVLVLACMAAAFMEWLARKMPPVSALIGAIGAVFLLIGLVGWLYQLLFEGSPW